MHRMHVNKAKSSRQFTRNSSRTKAANLAPNPMRGGIRL